MVVREGITMGLAYSCSVQEKEVLREELVLLANEMGEICNSTLGNGLPAAMSLLAIAPFPLPCNSTTENGSLTSSGTVGLSHIRYFM